MSEAEVLHILGESLHIEDQLRATFEELAYLIHDEYDAPGASAELDEIEHLAHAFVFAIAGADLGVVKGFRVGPYLPVEFGDYAGGEGDAKQKIVLEAVPRTALRDRKSTSLNS